MPNLLDAWKELRTDQQPFVLPGDELVLSDPNLSSRFEGWGAFTADPDFGKPGDNRLHLDLLPIPFVGNLKSASIFLLMLNPGLSAQDYYGEYEVPAYKTALLNNLKQTEEADFVFLDPRFAWHGGFNYWHTKLRHVIDDLSSKLSITYGQARSILQSRLAAIELVPYHSASFAVPSQKFEQLRSVKLAHAFVQNLLPRAREGECLIIATRAVKHWNLPEQNNVVNYSPNEARSAHLSPHSRGGSAIIEFIQRSYEREG